MTTQVVTDDLPRGAEDRRDLIPLAVVHLKGVDEDQRLAPPRHGVVQSALGGSHARLALDDAILTGQPSATQSHRESQDHHAGVQRR